MDDDIQPENEWDAHADGWDGDAAARAYAVAAFGSLREVMEVHDRSLDGARVLDFGCGTGLLTERLVPSGATIDAVDTSPGMLAVLDRKIAERKWTEVSTCSSLDDRRLADRAATYDLVVCSSVCGFLEDYPGTMQQLASMLRPGGLVVQWDWERDDTEAEPYGLSRDEIEETLRGAGFDSIDVDTAFAVELGEHTMRPLIGVGRRPVDPSLEP